MTLDHHIGVRLTGGQPNGDEDEVDESPACHAGVSGFMSRHPRQILPDSFSGRTDASKSSYGSSILPSGAKSGHGLAAGALAFQANDAGSTPAARSIKFCGCRLVAKTERCQRSDHGFESHYPLQVRGRI